MQYDLNLMVHAYYTALYQIFLCIYIYSYSVSFRQDSAYDCVI